MTAGERPNLGGLFTGSVPPERTSSVADALRAAPSSTRSAASSARVPSSAGHSSSAGASSAGAGRPTRLRVAVPSEATHERTVAPEEAPERSGLDWVNPVKAVELYFAVLQGLLDLNRNIAVGVVTAVLSVPRRVIGRR